MKKLKSLNDLAVTYRDSALNAINPGVPYSKYKTKTSKAYKTGNLYNKIAQSNTPESMVKPFGEDGFQIVLNVAPSGADYGQYVHYGTKGRMKPRPFGQLALEDPEFALLFEKVMGDKVEEKVDEFVAEVDEDFKKAGFTVS